MTSTLSVSSGKKGGKLLFLIVLSPPLEDRGGTQLNPIQGGGGPNQPPLSHICVYACGYAYTDSNFL